MAQLPPLTRRGLLGLSGLAAVLSACGSGPEKTGPPTTKGRGRTKIVYGSDHPDQYGVLRVPDRKPLGLAVLVHGGFWLDQYKAGLMDPMADALHDLGYATWNVEYRRVGTGGGFPATFDDIAAAFDKVAELDLPEGLDVFSIGHSAGGHLAVWAASRTDSTPGGAPSVTPTTTISLSGVLDLTSAGHQGIGNGAPQGLMNGDPDQEAAAYALGDPAALVPAKGRIVAVAAKDDDIVPPDQSSTYVKLDSGAGGDGALVSVPGGHFDLIDPSSDAWAQIAQLFPG
ncbi:acetyl esterase/lipase [Marmoricola sp. OAE513]|uniref:alpha/beta hydrolase family protein n=1 Tax=Marmoricola sp. OAE513 TaxID=2817894 RepID=UPI001AE5D8C7